MTIEEAIAELKKGRPKNWDLHRDIRAFDEAVVMAVKALELIPDNATNGDVIKALFPDADISLNDSCFEGVVNRYGFDEKWWNAPYRKE